MSKKNLTDCVDRNRREVLRIGATASAAGLLGLCCATGEKEGEKPAKKVEKAPSPEPAAQKEKKVTAEKEGWLSKPGAVVRVSCPAMREKLVPDPQISRRMIDEAVRTLASTDDIKSAWSRFLSADDKVALKVNGLGGPIAATQRVIVDALVESILDAGLKKENLAIFDQYESSMEKAGYPVNDKAGEVRVLSEKSMGYEPPRKVGVFEVNLAKALSWATAVINVPVLKEHPMCGVSGAIKNLVFGCVESPEFLHKDINEAMAEIYASTEMRSKVRLNIMDASHVQFDGGPMYSQSARAKHESIYASTDPVAIDAVEWEVVESLRAKNGLKTLTEAGYPPKFLDMAAKRGLGIADHKRIELTEIKVQPESA